MSWAYKQFQGDGAGRITVSDLSFQRMRQMGCWFQLTFFLGHRWLWKLSCYRFSPPRFSNKSDMPATQSIERTSPNRHLMVHFDNLD